MGVERFSAFCLFLLAVTGLGISQLTLTPDPPVMVEPAPSNSPNTLTFLDCIAGPPGISEDDFDTQWILPDGQIVPDEPDMGKIFINKGGRAQLNNVTVQITQLVILMLSYQDAGIYQCEVQNASLPGSPWISASVELQLRVSLQTNEMNITVSDTESEVELSCEMTLFVREDEDLQWFRDGQMIQNSGRRTVTYRDGTLGAAQRGGTIPGRVAVLTISNPVEEDSGTYTCKIAGTNESLDVQLSVLPAGGRPSIIATTQPTLSPIQTSGATSPATSPAITVRPTVPLTESDSSSEPQFLLPLFIVLGILLGITIVVIVFVITVFLWKRMTKHGKSKNTQEPLELSPQFPSPSTVPLGSQLLPLGSDEDTYYVNDGLGPHGNTDSVYYSYPMPIVQVKVKRNAAYGITLERVRQTNPETMPNIAYGQLGCHNEEERENQSANMETYYDLPAASGQETETDYSFVSDI